jgi:hypothetical protein
MSATIQRRPSGDTQLSDHTCERAGRTYARQARSIGSGKARARALRVDQTRESHHKAGDPSDPLARVCTAVMTCECEDSARGFRDAVVAAYERRPLLSAETPVLLSRWSFLWEREHALDAAEDRQAALYVGGAPGESYTDALRRHASTQAELADLVDELEARGVDARAVLLQPTSKSKRAK